MKVTSRLALALIGTAIGPVRAASESGRPRGLGPEFAKFYKSADSFTCISNPSIQLSLSQVNDDYCDCPDGSDEPGTSACAYLSPLSPPTPQTETKDGQNTTLALPGFYCKNKGHRPGYVPFTHVNDGICDYELCCDGSDEWEGVGGIKCEDRCKEIGKEWRKHDEDRQRLLTTAGKKRKELVLEAKRARKEVEDRLQTLGTQIEGLEIKQTAAENELAEIERKEKGKVIRGSTTGGKVGVLAGLAKERIEELRLNLERVRGQRDTTRVRLKEVEDILAKFKEEYNPNFNDEGVKRAVRTWEDYAARDKGSDGEPVNEADLDAMLKSDSENGLNWEEYQDASESEVELLYKFEEYLPVPVRDWLDQKLRDLRVLLIENGILAGGSTEGEEPKAVTDARQRLESVKNDLSAQKSELEQHKEDLKKDYGPEEIFRALKGRCVSTESGEYEYELCWLEKTTQKSKKGGGHTAMGRYDQLTKITVDEELPANGKGLGSGERWVMKFTNGQHCWNGPNRSTSVVMACAAEDEIWKVVEEEKCVYRMEVGTPAVCEPTGANAGATVGKDEL